MQRCHTYKIAVSILFFFLGGGGGVRSGGGGHRVDVNKVFVKIKKKKNWGGGVGGGVWG